MLNLQHPRVHAETFMILMYHVILIVGTQYFFITHQIGRGLHCIPLDIHTRKGQYLVRLGDK
jgi:hypothetical protein